MLVGKRIGALKTEREEAEVALALLEDSRRDSTTADPDDALAVLGALPDFGKRLAAADPEIRRAVFDAFRLRVDIDRNAGQIRLKALVSSAFGEATNLRTYPDRPAASRAACARLKAIKPLASCRKARWFSSFLDQRTRMPRLRLNHE